MVVSFDVAVSVGFGAVVCGEEDESVVRHAGTFQLSQNASHCVIQLQHKVAEDSATTFSQKLFVWIDGAMRANGGEEDEERPPGLRASLNESVCFLHPSGNHLLKSEAGLLKAFVVVGADNVGGDVRIIKRF